MLARAHKYHFDTMGTNKGFDPIKAKWEFSTGAAVGIICKKFFFQNKLMDTTKPLVYGLCNNTKDNESFVLYIGVSKNGVHRVDTELANLATHNSRYTIESYYHTLGDNEGDWFRILMLPTVGAIDPGKLAGLTKRIDNFMDPKIQAMERDSLTSYLDSQSSVINFYNSLNIT